MDKKCIDKISTTYQHICLCYHHFKQIITNEIFLWKVFLVEKKSFLYRILWKLAIFFNRRRNQNVGTEREKKGPQFRTIKTINIIPKYLDIMAGEGDKTSLAFRSFGSQVYKFYLLKENYFTTRSRIEKFLISWPLDTLLKGVSWEWAVETLCNDRLR